MSVPTLGLSAIMILLLSPGPPTRDDPPPARANPTELANFDGSWDIVSSTHEGKVAEGGTKPGAVYVFEGGRMAVVGRGPVGYGTIRVDPSGDLARMDWTYGDSPAKTATTQGIYKFEGETLTLCLAPLDERGRSASRPQRFDAREGTGTRLVVLKRVKSSIRLKDLPFPAYLIEPPAAGPPRAGGAQVGEAAPHILVQDAAGDYLPRAHFQGKVVLLTFWTLDPKSMSGMPLERLRELIREFGGDERFLILAVCVNGLEEWDAWSDFWRRHLRGRKEPGFGGRHWQDMVQADAEEPTTAQRYGADGLPAFFLIGADGRMAAVRIPPEELKAVVGRALRKKP